MFWLCNATQICFMLYAIVSISIAWLLQQSIFSWKVNHCHGRATVEGYVSDLNLECHKPCIRLKPLHGYPMMLSIWPHHQPEEGSLGDRSPGCQLCWESKVTPAGAWQGDRWCFFKLQRAWFLGTGCLLSLEV